MNLYFQFFTQDQSMAAIDLIQLPALLASGQTVGGKMKLSSAGRLTSSTFSDIKTLSDKISNVRFNEAEIIYHVKQLKIGITVAQVKVLNGVFYPSSTSELWFQSKDFPILDDRPSRLRTMNAKAKEQGLVSCGVAQEPSVFEVALEIETPDTKEKFLDNCAEWFLTALDGPLGGLKIFGCCDVGGKELFVRMESHVLMLDKIRAMAKLQPEAYQDMGKKFDDLHPLMFGAKQVCYKLAAALGKDAKLICGTGASDFAVIRLDPKCEIAAVRERAKNWLLPTMG